MEFHAVSSHWHLYVEVLRDGVWGAPDLLAPKGRWDFPTEFSWIHRGGHHWLFVGDDAIFPFLKGSPPTSNPSPLCLFIETDFWTHPDTAWEDQFRPHWISYEALFVDLWNDPGAVLVQSRVPAKFVTCFGHGQDGFPEASLMAAGCTKTDLIEWWQNARIADVPVNALFDPRPPSHGWPDKPAKVTWRASVRDLLGDEIADDFQALKQCGTASDLRVISLWQ
jgi:hypothetical protein